MVFGALMFTHTHCSLITVYCSLLKPYSLALEQFVAEAAYL